jgi:hypothetical protein
MILQLPKFAGTCVQVLVDGQPIGVMGWPPYELDITDAIRDGKVHELAIQVVGSRRNSFGPLHQADPEPAWTGPGNFETQGREWTKDYSLKPGGLLAAPVIIQRTTG